MKYTRSPVYRAQCRTWRRALQLCGITPKPGEGVATSGAHVLVTFRALPRYRMPEAKALRWRVAQSIKAERRAA